MILDKGICSVFRKTDTAAAGDMPCPAYTLIYQSWYGELSFETSPSYPTEGRREHTTDARIRVLQCRAIRQNDVVVLEDVGTVPGAGPMYRITRAYHGSEDCVPITDLSLEVTEP